jgi:hypothetical protein
MELSISDSQVKYTAREYCSVVSLKAKRNIWLGNTVVDSPTEPRTTESRKTEPRKTQPRMD